MEHTDLCQMFPQVDALPQRSDFCGKVLQLGSSVVPAGVRAK